MTLNDLETNESCRKIRALAGRLEELMRDGKELALFIALSDIEKAAQQAQYRMNDLKYRGGA